MPQMINNGNEMLRISTKGIEFSANGGRTWIMRYSLPTCGTFIDLLPLVARCLLSPQRVFTFQKMKGVHGQCVILSQHAETFIT